MASAILTDHKAATKSLTAWTLGPEMPDGLKYTTSSLGNLDCALGHTGMRPDGLKMSLISNVTPRASASRTRGPKTQKHKSSRKKGDGRGFPKREGIIAIRELVMSDEWCNEPSIEGGEMHWLFRAYLAWFVNVRHAARKRDQEGVQLCNLHLDDEIIKAHIIEPEKLGGEKAARFARQGL